MTTIFGTQEEARIEAERRAADGERVEVMWRHTHDDWVVRKVEPAVDNPRWQALVKHLGLTAEEAEEITSREPLEEAKDFEVGSAEYMVLTEDEADQRWEESLDSYIDDALDMSSWPEVAQRYFDRDAWKEDARHDGRGHSLSGYDGEENAEQIVGVWYYIYRTN